MIPEEIVENWIESQSELIDEKAASRLVKHIQSALAERTEQCAKICDDRIAFVDEKVSQLENPPVWDSQGYHVHTYAEACRFEAATLAQKIRALNQENKS